MGKNPLLPAFLWIVLDAGLESPSGEHTWHVLSKRRLLTAKGRFRGSPPDVHGTMFRVLLLTKGI